MMTPKWSEALLAQTKEALDTQNMDLMPTPDGKVHFKNRDGRYGSAPITLIMVGKLEITEKNMGISKFFPLRMHSSRRDGPSIDCLEPCPRRRSRARIPSTA